MQEGFLLADIYLNVPRTLYFPGNYNWVLMEHIPYSEGQVNE